MSNDEVARDATATIQGYMYQFDSTILSLCSMAHAASLDIEGIEDFDIATSDLTELFQCKYYEATRLTPATIRDAILPMLKGFIKLDKRDRSRQRFHLYGYFKDSTPGVSTLTLDQMKSALTRRETVTKRSVTKFIRVDIQKELSATDDELRAFASQLTIHVTVKAEEHRRRTTEALRRTCNVSHSEAELYVYPTALTLISTMACSPDRTKRRLSRAEFIANISPSRALFNQWSLREYGEKAYCIRMRREYFSERNIEPIQRIFIVDASLQSSETDLLALSHTLRHKWSSHAVRRKPDSERYAPTLFFRDLPDTRLVALKSALHNDGVHFVDGYPFLGSAFTPKHLFNPQTYANQLSLRVISSRAELLKALDTTNGERIAYDFYGATPTEPISNCKWVSLPVTCVSVIENII